MAVPFIEWAMTISQTAAAAAAAGTAQPFIDLFHEVVGIASEKQLGYLEWRASQFVDPFSEQLQPGTPPVELLQDARFIDALVSIDQEQSDGTITVETRTLRVPVLPGASWSQVVQMQNELLNAWNEQYKPGNAGFKVVSLWRVKA